MLYVFVLLFRLSYYANPPCLVLFIHVLYFHAYVFYRSIPDDALPFHRYRYVTDDAFAFNSTVTDDALTLSFYK